MVGRDSQVTHRVTHGKLAIHCQGTPPMSLSVISIFVCLDDFARTYEEWESHQMIATGRKRRRSGKLRLS